MRPAVSEAPRANAVLGQAARSEFRDQCPGPCPAEAVIFCLALLRETMVDRINPQRGVLQTMTDHPSQPGLCRCSAEIKARQTFFKTEVFLLQNI